LTSGATRSYRGDLAAGDIAERFDMTKPSISHHLGVLKQAGLVLDERRGQSIVYSLGTTVFQDVVSWALGLVASHRRGSAARRAGDDGRR
jgi:DNA-binding transcriptional ArsR family regulator